MPGSHSLRQLVVPGHLLGQLVQRESVARGDVVVARQRCAQRARLSTLVAQAPLQLRDGNGGEEILYSNLIFQQLFDILIYLNE